MRRWAWLLASLAALGSASACKREPTFDERYAGAQKVIREKVSELDNDMATRAAEAEAIAPAASGQPAEANGVRPAQK